jgi:hypothetical protein
MLYSVVINSNLMMSLLLNYYIAAIHNHLTDEIYNTILHNGLYTITLICLSFIYIILLNAVIIFTTTYKC